MPKVDHPLHQKNIIITQDRADKMWYINLNPATLTFFRMTNYEHNDILYFSITSKHDPNILYRSLKIPVSMLAEQLVMPFENNSETKNFVGTTCAPMSPPVGRESENTRSTRKKINNIENKIEFVIKGEKLLRFI